MSQASAIAAFQSAAAAVGCHQGAAQSTGGAGAAPATAVRLSTLNLGVSRKSITEKRPSIAQKIMRLGASGSDSDGSLMELSGGGGSGREGNDDSDFD